MRVLFIVILGLMLTQAAIGQNVFTLNDAISAAMEHNHGVLVSDIETDIAENSVTRGNAGQLPNLAITGGLSTSYTDLNITPGSFFQNLLDPQNGGQQGDRPSISYDGVTTTQLNTQIGTQFVIYDGMKGRLRYKTLEAGSDLADLQYRSELENTILKVTNRFIRVASLQRAIDVKETSLEQSTDR